MASESPISEGFRRAFREPAIVVAEIVWRWTFGLAALALAAASFGAYLDTLRVTNLELLALRGHPRWLIADAVGHILHGGPRLVRAAAIVLPAIFVLWVAAATIGRAATLKALLRRESTVALGPQFGLNLLRASVTLASLVGYLGAAILAGRAASGAADVRGGIFLVIFVVLGTAVAMVRSRVNWFLYLGAIPAARDGHHTFSAISEAVGLFRRHPGRFAGAGAVFGTIHGVLFAFCTVVCLLALSLAGKVPPVVTLFLLAVITLAYFAAVDFLYIARLAAYVTLDESDRMPPPVAVAPESPPPAPEPLPVPELPPVSEPGLPSPEGATS
ncbi:MAG TPA: hypothetical protein VES66_09960 [Terriglobales bacterium]|nr:hypothetical protein [Terriglobales bacterium]